jgi:hypothetical protein
LNSPWRRLRGGRLALFNATGRPLAALERLEAGAVKAGVYGSGLDLLLLDASFSGAALASDMPLPAAAPLALIGLGALPVAGRRRA